MTKFITFLISSNIYYHNRMSENTNVLDAVQAISVLGDEETFLSMLLDFNSTTLDPCLEKLKKGIEEKNNKEVRLIAHTLKGSSLYVGATRLSNISKEMQFAIDKNEIEHSYNLYPKLLEISILTKIEIRKYLRSVSKDGKEAEESDYVVPVAKGYEMIKKDNTNFKVVLRESQYEKKERQRSSRSFRSPRSPRSPKTNLMLNSNQEQNTKINNNNKENPEKNLPSEYNSNHVIKNSSADQTSLIVNEKTAKDKKEIKEIKEIKKEESFDDQMKAEKEKKAAEKKENKPTKLDFHRLEEDPIHSHKANKNTSNSNFTTYLKKVESEDQKLSKKVANKIEYNGMPINGKNSLDKIEDNNNINESKRSNKVIYQPSEEYNGLPINEKNPLNDYESDKKNLAKTNNNYLNSPKLNHTHGNENNKNEKASCGKVKNEDNEEIKKDENSTSNKNNKKNKKGKAKNDNTEEASEGCSCGCNII